MTRYYPGSKTPVKETKLQAPISQLPEADELGRSKTFLVDGKPQEFYGVGELASALNRRSVTIRKWESDGTIPNATFILPSDDKRGRRRLYTRAQIEGLKRIAQEEGLLEPNANGKWKALEETKFRTRALQLFKELEGHG